MENGIRYLVVTVIAIFAIGAFGAVVVSGRRPELPNKTEVIRGSLMRIIKLCNELPKDNEVRKEAIEYCDEVIIPTLFPKARK